jgi:hypothetical protein
MVPEAKTPNIDGEIWLIEVSGGFLYNPHALQNAMGAAGRFSLTPNRSRGVT